MKEIIDSIIKLIETVNKFRIATIILVIATLSGVLIYIKTYVPRTPSTNTNPISIPVKLANNLDNLLEHISEELESDITAIGLYKYDDIYEEQYIVFLRQHTSGSTYPIPNAKYFLSTNNLYDRYRQHKKGKCYIRSFENTNSKVAISCPFFGHDGELAGYITNEYVTSTPPSNIEDLRLRLSKYVPAIEKELVDYLKKNKSISEKK